MTDSRQVVLDYFNGNFQTFYEKYLPKLKSLSGNEYQSPCPFHDDENPSFNFNNQTGQYYCHGCGKKGDIIHFYGKINSLDTRRDFGKILKGIARDFGIQLEQVKPKIIKVYDYYDADGRLLFQVCRMEPKDFRQRHQVNGKWVWNLKGVKRVLYRLPEVLRADEVLIVEGEKDADRLSELGFTATTNPMGAEKWEPEYTDNLKGKHVVLIPDNDEPGRKHMQKVAAELQGKVTSLKWLDLPGLPNKGDVSDFIDTFKDKSEAAERLSIMIEGAAAYKPVKPVTIEDSILEIGAFCTLGLDKRVEYLSPWIKEGSISLISGWRGAGKTWFALGILDAITRGVSFGPWKCENPVPCLLLDGEMPVQDITERANEMSLNSKRGKSLFIYSDAYSNQLGLSRAHLASDTWRQKMKRVLITHKVKLFVIDNLASLASGLDENVKKDWDPINQWLLELRFAGISTIMLHHVNKDGSQRGTSAREDNLDTSIILKTPNDYTPEDGCRFIAHFSKARVRTSELNSISDIEFKLIQDEAGKLIWTWGNVKAEIKNQVLQLLDEGLSQIDIHNTLNVDKGYISRIRKNAIKEGVLTAKNKLTQSGFLTVNAN